MTVQELIEKLQKVPSHLLVEVPMPGTLHLDYTQIASVVLDQGSLTVVIK